MNTEIFANKLLELDPAVRGDRITGERYYTREWMKAEWEKVWTRVWHIGGCAADLEETGDFLVHNIGAESVVMLKQKDGSIRAFYNACAHRGYRLAWTEIGGAEALTCAYHGWKWAPDGTLLEVQDPEDFPLGNPCGRTKLVEVACEVWMGFVWINMDRNAPSVRAWLGPIADQIDSWQPERMTRILYLTAEVDCNWKIIRDNFNESYHIPTVHPEIKNIIDDDYRETLFEMYPNTHNHMVMKGVRPSGRYPTQDIVEPPLADALTYWGLDPKAFEERAMDARVAIQQQKRKHGVERGYAHYATMTDSQLTDYHHYTLFPNVTFTMWPDGFQVLRSEPHPTDPEKCVFDHWFVSHAPVPGTDQVDGPMGPMTFKRAERVRGRYGEMELGPVAEQDLSIAEGQQLGLHSRGYWGGLLPNQEKRVQRFHEILNDYIEGRR